MAFLRHTLATLWDTLGLATWIQIRTTDPPCLYYFGPFLSSEEAQQHHPDFLQDLSEEGAQGIESQILQGLRPAQLTQDFSATSTSTAS